MAQIPVPVPTSKIHYICESEDLRVYANVPVGSRWERDKACCPVSKATDDVRYPADHYEFHRLVPNMLHPGKHDIDGHFHNDIS